MEKLKYTVIKDADQYKKYCDILEELILNEIKLTKDEIELLTLLIEIWDNEHNSFKDSDPIELLKALMDEHNLKAKDLVEILELSKNNKIILIYPIPEVGWNPNKQVYNQWVKRKFNKNFNLVNVTTSYKVYKDRTKSSFELLNSTKGDNIYRVYPHKLFCDTIIKDRCVTHDDKNVFYYDDDHISIKGAEMINDLIMKEIEKIELKSN